MHQKVNKYNDGANSLISILPRREDKRITFLPVSLISLSVFSPIRTSLKHSSPWSPSSPYRNQIIVLDLSKSPSFSFSRVAFTLSHWLSKELWYTREQMTSSGVVRCGMSWKTNLFSVSSEREGVFFDSYGVHDSQRAAFINWIDLLSLDSDWHFSVLWELEWFLILFASHRLYRMFYFLGLNFKYISGFKQY